MERRRESVIDMLFALPWWSSAIAAALAYLILMFVVPMLFGGNQFTVGFGLAAKTYAPYGAAFFIVLGLASYIRAVFVTRQFHSLAELEDIRRLSWRRFESVVGEAFRRRGYSVLEKAVDGADTGIDLVLKKDGRKFYVQCKQWKQTTVGVRPVRELLSVIIARRVAGGYLVTAGKYTQEARDFAQNASISLIDGDALAVMVEEARAPQPFMDPTIRSRDQTLIRHPVRDPQCPACGGAMVRRTAKRGNDAGDVFWGCEMFPKCRGTRPL